VTGTETSSYSRAHEGKCHPLLWKPNTWIVGPGYC